LGERNPFLQRCKERLHVEAKKSLRQECSCWRRGSKRGDKRSAHRGDHGHRDHWSDRERLEDREQLKASMEPAERVYALFKEKVGHTLCSEIHKIRYGKVYRLFVPEEMEAFHNMGGHDREGCPEVCGMAARIAAEVILDMKKEF